MHNRLWHSLSEFNVESYTVYAYFVKRLLLKGGSLFTLIFYVCGVGLGVRRPPNTLYDNRRTMCMTAVVPPCMSVVEQSSYCNKGNSTMPKLQ